MQRKQMRALDYAISSRQESIQRRYNDIKKLGRQITADPKLLDSAIMAARSGFHGAPVAQTIAVLDNEITQLQSEITALNAGYKGWQRYYFTDSRSGYHSANGCAITARTPAWEITLVDSMSGDDPNKYRKDGSLCKSCFPSQVGFGMFRRQQGSRR